MNTETTIVHEGLYESFHNLYEQKRADISELTHNSSVKPPKFL